MAEKDQRRAWQVEPEANCWPTPEQELLLRAALRDGEVGAWEEWRRRVRLEDVDAGSHRLLPLLYRRLSKQGVAHPDLQRYAGVYKLVWYRNQIIFRQMDELLALFQSQGIDTLILKGTSLILLYYRDFGTRAMNDFDILVPTESVRQAIQALEAAGWSTEFPTSEWRLRLTHSMLFRDAEEHEFDLHWHVMEEACLPGDDRAFWQDSIPITHNGIQARALNPTDQLLHNLIHGLRWAEMPPVRWVADSILLLEQAGSQVDWERLYECAIRSRLTVPLYTGLSYLSRVFQSPIPSQVVTRFGQAAVSRREVVEFRVKARRRNPWRRLRFHWFNYRRLRPVIPATLPVLGFVRYLQGRWGVERLWELPLFIWAESRRRRKAAQSRVAMQRQASSTEFHAGFMPSSEERP